MEEQELFNLVELAACAKEHTRTVIALNIKMAPVKDDEAQLLMYNMIRDSAKLGELLLRIASDVMDQYKDQ